MASPVGLCPECAATADTAEPTSREFVPADPTPELPTTTAAPASASPTATAAPAATTATGAETSSTPLPSAPAGYDLLDRLGAGGMGAVYLAREQAAERLVAMKFLHQPASADAMDRFLVELRVLAHLDHPNIVRVLASDFLRADPYFTMEHMSGGSLSRAIDAGTPVPVGEAVRLVRTVADAICAAHARGVIHRDLKPSNILLTANGTPKVSDFGLAKRLDYNDGLTATAGALGTPSYMPPEQISRKNGETGPWSDVYGLGATLYHLLTGRAPFVGESPEEIIPQVLIDPPRRLRALRADIPAALEGIVLKCLEKDPKDRYQSVADLAADLDRFTAGQRPVAPPLTRWRRAKRWAKRNRQELALSGLAVAAVTGVIAFADSRRRNFPPVEPPRVAPVITWQPAPANPVALTPFTPELTPNQVRAELQNGRPVLLVGPTAPRVPLAWGLGTCAVVDSASGDTRFSLLNRDNVAILHLLDDPGIDHYRIRAELRQDLKVPEQKNLTAQAGLVVGHVRVRAGTDAVAHAFSTVEFTEYAPDNSNRMVEFADRAIFERPLRPLDIRQHHRAVLPLTREGQWRMLDIEVSRDSVTVRHGGGSATRSLVEIRHTVSGRVDELPRSLPGGEALVVPPWSPRFSLGIWVSRSWVSIRNVMIEPIP